MEWTLTEYVFTELFGEVVCVAAAAGAGAVRGSLTQRSDPPACSELLAEAHEAGAKFEEVSIDPQYHLSFLATEMRSQITFCYFSARAHRGANDPLSETRELVSSSKTQRRAHPTRRARLRKV